MYFKYSGNDKQTGKVRISFLSDGLFRFTQPRFLNDPKEGKPKIFVHEYSPKDIELAKRKLEDSNFIPFGGEINDEDVMTFGLNPFPARRMGDAFPHLLRQDGFSSMKEYDEAQLLSTYQKFDNQLNSEIGVISLTTDNKNQVMWSSYSNEYNGIVIGFSDEIKNSTKYISQCVEYDPDKIKFQISLNKGIVRFNGLNINKAQDNRFEVTNDILKSFLFHKEEKWEYEEEFRMVSWLRDANKNFGEVYLEKISFDLFQAVYIGNKVSKEERNKIFASLKNNDHLTHIKVYLQAFNKLTGDIEFVPIGL